MSIKDSVIDFLFSKLDAMPEYSKICLSTILKYSLVGAYYDGGSLCCNIPISDLICNSSLRSEVLNLLGETPFEDDNGIKRSWGLEYTNCEFAGCVIVRPVVRMDSMLMIDYIDKCSDMVNNYNGLSDYYDPLAVCCNIPIDDIRDNKLLKDGILGLLSIESFTDNDGIKSNWALEVYKEEGKTYVFIRVVESSV